ncbi:MAG: class I SAM-dependent methyltransferase [Spirochaetes bacterium]|nr:class I SAM-dependent methyltransferase [Spirochaetota bacterium]
MKCLNCGSNETSTINLELEDMTICKNCGYGRPSLQTSIQYDENYEKKYLAYPEAAINKIRLSFISEKGTILDYGCGSGSFVKAARQAGYVAYGYDINDFTADLRPPEGFQPDIITAWDSFEHLTDEQQIEFFKIAENAKLIVLSVPDFDTPKKDQRLGNWRHYRPKEHLHYYTPIALYFRFRRERFNFYFACHAEDKIRKAPWENNILTAVFKKYE